MKNMKMSDLDEVKVIIKTVDTGERGVSMVKSMSMNINVQIERAGIFGATVTRKQMEYLRKDPKIKYVEYDQKVSIVRDTSGNLRNLAEETPYGIPMVLQDMDFWKGLGAPSGSIKVCVADTGMDLGHEDLPNGDDVTGSDSTSNGSWNSDGHGHGTHCSGTVA